MTEHPAREKAQEMADNQRVTCYSFYSLTDKEWKWVTENCNDKDNRPIEAMHWVHHEDAHQIKTHIPKARQKSLDTESLEPAIVVGSSIVDGPLYLGPAGILMSIGLEKVEILWYWDQKTTRHDKEYLNILRLESQSEQIMRVALAAG